jgi:hypothetical protein
VASFKLDELSGSLIKSGNFSQAICPFFAELDEAMLYGVISRDETRTLQEDFAWLLLNPDAKKADYLGSKMLNLALRIPGKMKPVSSDEFDKNVENSRSEAK